MKQRMQNSYGKGPAIRLARVLRCYREGLSDNLDKSWLIKFVEHRVADPRILRPIQKWLKAGVMEEGKWRNFPRRQNSS